MSTDNIKSHIISTTVCLVSALTLCLTAMCCFSSNGKSIPCNIETEKRQYCENIPIVGIKNGCNQCFMNSAIQVLLSCPEFCQYLDDPRTIAEGNNTANILRNILHQVRNSPNGSVVNITPDVNQLRMKYYGNSNKGGDERFVFYEIFSDLKQGSQVFHNYYQRKILSANELPIHTLNVNNSDFKYPFTLVCTTENKMNLQTAFQRSIRYRIGDTEKYNAYEQNIFIVM